MFVSSYFRSKRFDSRSIISIIQIKFNKEYEAFYDNQIIIEGFFIDRECREIRILLETKVEIYGH